MSNAELLLAEQLRQAGIEHIREHRFVEGRKFRADFIILSMPRLMVEVEGGTWTGGRHVTGTGVESDCEKSALAAIAGYRFMRVTTRQVNDGRALSWIQQALGLERAA